MPRFFLHLHECGTLIDDEDGVVLADLADARSRAVLEARTVMSSEVREGRLCLSCYILVETERHEEVYRLPFHEALTITGLAAHVSL